MLRHAGSTLTSISNQFDAYTQAVFSNISIQALTVQRMRVGVYLS